MQVHGALHAGTQQLGLPDPKSLRILVVDSKAVSRQNTTQLLRECAYQVTAVKTARECIQLLIEAEHGAGFDLVLKEHEPPGANACRLLKRMAKTEGLSRTPIVVTSTQDERDTVMACLSMGAIDYLIKPLRQNELRHIWTRVWWWRKSQGQHVATYPSVVAHAPRHYAFRGPGSANRQYEATSSDSKQTKCQEEEEPTSKEGSAPDNNNGNGSKGNGSNGSKEGNGTSRVDAQGLHCDIKDTGHGSNGNGHGSNNGNGHGSNGNGSNGSSDNKNGGNGNSATKGDGNGNGSNGNGASTTLAVDRHYQALVNTAEGKMPPNLGASHDGLTGVIKSGTMGRSSAFAQYTGPSTSSRKRAATSEAVAPGTRDRDPRADPMDEDNTGAGDSALPTVEGIATGGGGGISGGTGGGPGVSGSGGGLGRSKTAAQRERAAAALRAAGGGHAASEDTFQQHTNPNRSGGGGAGGSGSGGPGSNGGGGGLGNNGSSSHHHTHTKQLAVSSERPGSQGISPSHYISMHTHTPSGGVGGVSGGSRATAVQQQQHPQHPQPQLQTHGSAGWPSGLLPHPHAALAGLAPAVVPPGLPAELAGMFPAPFGLTPGHMLSRMAHPALRFGPGAPSQEPMGLQSIFHFSPPEVLAAAAAAVAAASAASKEVHSHAAVRGGPHGVHATHGPPHSLLLGALPSAEGPGAGTVAPTSGATNLNAIILNQLLASGVPLAFLGQPNPLSALSNAQGPGHPAQPGTRGPPHPPQGPSLAHHHHHPNLQQAAAAAVAAAAAAAAVWRPPPFTHPATMAAAAVAAGAVLPFPGPMAPGGHSGAPLGDLQAGGPGGICGAGLQHRDASQAAAVAAALLAAAHDGGCASAGRSGRPSLVGIAEPKRRRALALDKYRKKRKNLRFSKTIRYEARKQLAQQRPRVRGQFTKHCIAGGDGGDDGAATLSNGAKSGTGGAGDVVCDDGGGEEVHTSSRGYYEEEDYDVGEAEEDETEAELDEMELEGSRDRAGQSHPRSRTGQRQTQPMQQAELEDMDMDADTLGRSGGAVTEGTAPASASGGGGGAGSTHDVQPTSNSPAPSGATVVAKRTAAGGGGGMGGSLRGMGGGGVGGGHGGMSEGGYGVEIEEEEEDPAAAVVRSLLGLRDAAHAARQQRATSHLAAQVSRPQAEGAAMSGPAPLQEMKSSRSVGSQGSLSREWGRDRDRDRERDRDRDRSGRERDRERERERGHSRGHSHSHGHSHSQQQQHSQGHSRGVQGLGGLPHGHARTHSLLRQGSSAAETPAGVINQPTAASQSPRAPSPTGGILPGGPSPQQPPQGGPPMHVSGGPGTPRYLSFEPLLTNCGPNNCNPALQQHQQHPQQNPSPAYQQHHAMHHAQPQIHKLGPQVTGLHGHGSVSPSQQLSYMGVPSSGVPQSGQGQAGCGCAGPAGSGPRGGTHSSTPLLQQPQQAVSQQQQLQAQAASHGAGVTGAGAAAVSGRGAVSHGMGCDPRDGREHREREGREREREHRDAGRDREARDREAGAMLGDAGTGNGKNGSDSGSNSPDENGAGGGTGRAKSAAEKAGHGNHKAASGHGHGHR